MMEYDLIFYGQLCFDEDIRQDGSKVESTGGAASYGAIAAVCAGKKVSVLYKLDPKDEPALDFLKERGVDITTISAPVTTRVEVSHPTGKADERNIVTLEFSGQFTPDEIRDVPGRWVHLAGCNDHDFSMDFIKAIKERGAPLSIDLQCLVRHNDPDTGVMSFLNDPNKRDIIELMDMVKLDVLEAELLTGTSDLAEAAEIIESWGCPEIVITREDGVCCRADGQYYFEPFSNETLVGRTGRGDTTFGAYLARRLDYGPQESLKFAAALVSLKMEQPGPYTGTVEAVLERMRIAHA